MVTIELSDIDALRFKQFMEHYDHFVDLRDNGFFDIRGGNATVHFDELGRIRKIDKQLSVFIVLKS